MTAKIAAPTVKNRAQAAALRKEPTAPVINWPFGRALFIDILLKWRWLDCSGEAEARPGRRERQVDTQGRVRGHRAVPDSGMAKPPKVPHSHAWKAPAGRAQGWDRRDPGTAKPPKAPHGHAWQALAGRAQGRDRREHCSRGAR